MISSPLSTEARPRLVLLHGLASSPKEFSLLIHPLRRRGVELLAPEVPGYSTGRLSENPRAEDWVAAATQVVKELTEESSQPFVLGGLCTGGMLAAAVAASGKLAGRVSGLAILSPTLACDGWGLPYWYRLRHVAYSLGLSGLFSMKERAPYGLKNVKMRERVRRQLEEDGDSEVGPRRVSLKNVREGERLASRFLDNVALIDLPMDVQHAREDEVCSLDTVQRAITRLPRPASSRCTLHVLENSYHMVSADNDRQLVADHLAAFSHGLVQPRRAHATQRSALTSD